MQLPRARLKSSKSPGRGAVAGTSPSCLDRRTHPRGIAAAQRIAARHAPLEPPPATPAPPARRNRVPASPSALAPVQPEPHAQSRPRRRDGALRRASSARIPRQQVDPRQIGLAAEIDRVGEPARHRSRGSCRTPRSARPARPRRSKRGGRRKVTVAPSDARDRTLQPRIARRRTSAAARRHSHWPPARPHRASPPIVATAVTRANRRRPAIATRQRASPSSARHSGEVSSHHRPLEQRRRARAARRSAIPPRVSTARSSLRPVRRPSSPGAASRPRTAPPARRPSARRADRASPIAAPLKRAGHVHRIGVETRAPR